MNNISRRDYFAAHASEEDIERYAHTGGMEEYVYTDSAGRRYIRSRPKYRSRELARFAYADAMLKASLEKL